VLSNELSGISLLTALFRGQCPVAALDNFAAFDLGIGEVSPARRRANAEKNLSKGAFFIAWLSETMLSRIFRDCMNCAM